jgi:hypothetical protein
MFGAIIARRLSPLACRFNSSLRSGYARLSTTAADAAAKDAQSTAQFWGTIGALANWGLAGSAMYDAYFKGPEIISLNMTCVQMCYSALFARWAWVVVPRNLLLMACHVTNVAAQTNQLRRCIEYKLATEPGAKDEVAELGQKAAVFAGVVGTCMLAAPTVRASIAGSSIPLAGYLAADAGPFTPHFWAPMSKWLISGASMLDINRPTDKISVAQYTALTATGAVFSRYALAVTPVNYMLCAVNIALFLSSGWMLGRKVKADYM